MALFQSTRLCGRELYLTTQLLSNLGVSMHAPVTTRQKYHQACNGKDSDILETNAFISIARSVRSNQDLLGESASGSAWTPEPTQGIQFGLDEEVRQMDSNPPFPARSQCKSQASVNIVYLHTERKTTPFGKSCCAGRATLYSAKLRGDCGPSIFIISNNLCDGAFPKAESCSNRWRPRTDISPRAAERSCSKRLDKD